ncbi:phosphotransferase enzyme family protein [Hypoxylon sp. FL1857]|nr:phosphotransferase enzyme family protein [Hypoxylon sp. FL1857]
MAETTKLGSKCSQYIRDGQKIIVKSGPTTRMAEAETMKFVRGTTDVPVPEVYDAYRDSKSGQVIIVMEYVEGERLDKVWGRLSREDKMSITVQLSSYFMELRGIHGRFIGSIDGSPCADPYFASDPEAYGPYDNEVQFNRGLVKAWLTEREDEPFIQLLCDTLIQTMTGHKIVLTHNNLDPRNILVRGSEVVAILDWEQAGYYPEYWEYCRALWRPNWHSNWMKERVVDKILKPYPQELAVMWNTSDITW